MDPYTLAHDLLLQHLLSPLRIPCQLIQLLLSRVFLRNLELTLDLPLYRVFVLCLDLLGLPQDVPEFVRQRPIHRLLDPGLWLVFV